MSGTVSQDEVSVRKESCFVVCDVASRRMPDRRDSICCSLKHLESHNARAIGASGITQKRLFGLSGALDGGTMSCVMHDLDRPPQAHENMSLGTKMMVVSGKCDLPLLQCGKKVGYGSRSLGWALDEAVLPQTVRELVVTGFSLSLGSRGAAHGLPSVTMTSRTDLSSVVALRAALANGWSKGRRAAVTSRNEGAWR